MLGSSQADTLANLSDLQTNNLKDSGGYQRTVQAYSATLNYQFHGIELTSVSGYNVEHTYNTIDYTGILGDCCTEPASLLAAPGVNVAV